MNKISIRLSHWKKIVFAILVAFIPVGAFQETPVIYHISIEGTIDVGLVPYVKRVIRDAEANHARAILVEINTLGGRLDAMIEIRDAIFDSKVRVIGYVNKRAISAGALIALACPELYVVPGATIGAATPVDERGVKASEKVVSYARTEFKATAERNNRPVDIAMAMVDEDIAIDSLVEKGKLLTLTAEEAVKYKIADGTFDSQEQLLEELQLKNATIQAPEPNWAENVIRVINHPVLSGILLTIGLLGLITEVTTAGWGIPGTVGLIALVMYFGTSFMVGLAGVQELILVLAGIILMLLEVFVIPGFGIAGILGIVCMIGGVIMSMIGKYPTTGDVSVAVWITIGSLAVAIVGTILLIRLFQKRPFWANISLPTQVASKTGFVSAPKNSERIGQVGVALTHLRPSGSGLFNDERLDVITEGEYLDAGAKIIIVKDEGYRLIVRKKEN